MKGKINMWRIIFLYGEFKFNIIKLQIYKIKIIVTMELDENEILKVETEEKENLNKKKKL